MASDEFENLVALLAAGKITADTPIEQARAGYDAVGAMVPLVDGTTTEPLDPTVGVAGEWVRAPHADDRRTVVWLHGGGYVIGSPTSHRPFASRLSAASQAPVLLVDYRLAPEHPAPAAIDDALAAWRHVLDLGRSAGQVALGGDSAGGGLAVCTALILRDLDIALPAGLALASPWIDFSLSADSLVTNADTDVVLSGDLLTHWSQAYLGGADPRTASLAPLDADARGLPPMLIHVARRELLYDDALRLTRWARDAELDATLVVDDEMIHHWHVFAGLFPEADRAVAELGAWLDERLT